MYLNNRAIKDDLRRFLLDLTVFFLFAAGLLRRFARVVLLLVGTPLRCALFRVGALRPERSDLAADFLDLRTMVKYRK
jgi:hypothetical protein